MSLFYLQFKQNSKAITFQRSSLSKYPWTCHRVISLKCRSCHLTHLFKIPQWHPLTYRMKSNRLKWHELLDDIKIPHIFSISTRFYHYSPNSSIKTVMISSILVLHIYFFFCLVYHPNQYSGIRLENSYLSRITTPPEDDLSQMSIHSLFLSWPITTWVVHLYDNT